MASKDLSDFPTLPVVENPDHLFEILGIEKSKPEAPGADKQPLHEEPAQPPSASMSSGPSWANIVKKGIDPTRVRANFKIKEVDEDLIELDRVRIETLRCKYPMRWAAMGDSDDELDYDDYRDKPNPLPLVARHG